MISPIRFSTIFNMNTAVQTHLCVCPYCRVPLLLMASLVARLAFSSAYVTQDQLSCLHSPYGWRLAKRHSNVDAGNTRIKASSGLSTQVLNNRVSDANQLDLDDQPPSPMAIESIGTRTTVNTAPDSSLPSVPSDEEFPALHKAIASYFTTATNLIYGLYTVKLFMSKAKKTRTLRRP
ncbi:hypothetical protein B0H16DRAFT_1510940 [Mycena metata]|uniref:Uncharacterized protein n=1 Tax=Mycena metata TaxID=1033252 RepID=A0AAD7NTP0_9AGAR|nr:hypothetical protein B0H16DRAFT_1510940 [Mycena metata]